MRVVWQLGEVTVRDVYEYLAETQDIAYTTVMTTMHRLALKGFLERSEPGKTHIFWPTVSEDEYLRSALHGVLDWLVARFDNPALAYLVHPGDREDLESLKTLLRAVEERREELSKRH